MKKYITLVLCSILTISCGYDKSEDMIKQIKIDNPNSKIYKDSYNNRNHFYVVDSLGVYYIYDRNSLTTALDLVTVRLIKIK